MASDKGIVVFIASIHGMVGLGMRLYGMYTDGESCGLQCYEGSAVQSDSIFIDGLAPSVGMNAVSHGGVWREQPDAFVDRYVQKTPVGRMAIEEELKGAVGVLAIDLSAYVTGHNLVEGGGWTAW